MSLMGAAAGKALLATLSLAVAAHTGSMGRWQSTVTADAVAIATTTTMQLPSDELLSVTSMEFSANVQPAPASGQVALYDVVGGGHKFLSVNSVYPSTGDAYFIVTGSALGVGPHELVAEYTDPDGTYQASASAPQALEVIKVPISLSLSTTKTALYPEESLTLRATSPDNFASGEITFVSDGPGDLEVVLGSIELHDTGFGYRAAELEISSLALGEHVITASLPESELVEGAVSNSVTVTSAKRPSDTSIGWFVAPQAGQPFEIRVAPTAGVHRDGLPLPTGTVTLLNGATSLGTKPVVDGAAWYPVTLPAGTFTLTASYTGDAHYAPSSNVQTLVVAANVVEAEGVGVQYSTFYPVVDGYRDSVAIKGSRFEAASVAIRILGPTGTTVRTATIASASGTYSYLWNGRNAAGALLPAGRYTAVQTLTDSQGAKETVTSLVRLSHGRLVTKTAYVTRDGSAISAKGSSGGGSVTTSTSGGYAKIDAGSGWASAGWEFSIPAAFIYKSVAIEVYAKAGWSAPPIALGTQNFQSCPRTTDWNETCFERWVALGNSPPSVRWYSTSPSSSAAYRSGRFVRGIITADYGAVFVYEARAKVVYQVLEGDVVTGRVVVAR